MKVSRSADRHGLRPGIGVGPSFMVVSGIRTAASLVVFASAGAALSVFVAFARADAESIGLRRVPFVDFDLDLTPTGSHAPAASSDFNALAALAAGLLIGALAIVILVRPRLARLRAEANRAELVRQRLAAQVEDILHQREAEAEALRVATEAAQAAHAGAEAASRAKSDFLASMSHEIRTPLNAIIGFAHLLLDSHDLTEAARRHADRIKCGGDALLSVVDDILHFSEAESGRVRLDPQPFSLPLLVDACVSLVEGAAVSRHLSLRVELKDRFPAGLLGDEARLRQILLNLLNNAIKFTRQGSVTLSIGYDRAQGRDRVLFEVVDTGIGIAEADMPRLFQRFSQVDGTIRRTFGGTGLGLAISKTLVDLMGGTIGVRSEVGRGSTFWFAIDLETVPLVLEAPAQSVPKTTRTLDILIAEDTAINQELAAAILGACGHRVDIVGDGAEAIMAAEDKAYDLVLMDVQMPFVDGLTATRAIRRLASPHCAVPIVAMTANVMAEQVAAARASGMNDVLAKPLDLDALRGILDRIAHSSTVEAPFTSPTVGTDGLIKLIKILGAPKVETMLGTLRRSLEGRFTVEMTPDNVAVLKADAHASVAGAGMLGFERFAAACRAFMAAEEPRALAERHAGLMRERADVMKAADRYASRLPDAA